MQGDEQGQTSAPTNDDLLNATTPEALAALMARANESTQQGVTDPAQAPGETTAVDAASTTPAQAPASGSATPGASGDESVGVATKSGKGVLPFRVLAEERQEKQHWRTHAQDLETKLATADAELQALRNGGTGQQQADALGDLTDEEIAAAEADFPLLAKVARRMKNAPAPTQAPAAPHVDPQDEADDVAAAVNNALATLPLLSKWQQTGGVVWGRAIELDNQLKGEPAFSAKTLGERFAEVQKRLAGELGIQEPAPTASRTPAAAPAQPPAAMPELQSIRPNTLSDLQGGASAGHDPINSNVSGMDLAARFARMSPAELEAAVRRATS